MERPIKNTYWIEPGRLLAGEYPGDKHPDAARKRIRAFVDAGINTFIDLTHPYDPLDPYEPYLLELAPDAPIRPMRLHHPIRDVSIPEHPDQMHAILDAIDDALGRSRGVYVHCWGGVGRTGTVVGCYLVRRGLPGPEAVKHLQQLWGTCEKSRKYALSPETVQQREFILNWQQWEIR